MFAHTAFSPLLAVRMAAFDHSVCITTVKVSIISFFCLSTKMRRITNFGLERRASHASRSSLFQDSWITPVTISDPKLVYSSYFSSLPSFLDESFLVQQNHGCHWTSYKPASFREKTWWICTRVHLLVFILPKDSSSKKLARCFCNRSVVCPGSSVSFDVCFYTCRPNAFSHWNSANFRW